MKVDEYNGKEMVIGNVRYRKNSGFQAMSFVRTLVVSFKLLPLVLGDIGCGSRKMK